MAATPGEIDRRLAGAPAVRAARQAIGGLPAWIVGGAVRDAALGRGVADIDLAVVPGEEEGVARRIAGEGAGHAFQLSRQFATWRAVAGDRSWHADVSALRRPAIEDDLAARDFTVDAIAVPTAGGELLDPTGGLADIEAGVLRAPGDGAFEDDPLRVLRAARLGATLGLEVEAGTLKLGRRAAPRISDVAGERQLAELRGILAGPDPLRGLELMDALGATAVVLPELEALRGVVQNPNHHLDVHGHTIAVLANLLDVERDLERFCGEQAAAVEELLAEPLADELDRRAGLRFGALVHDMGKPATRAERGGHVTFIGHDEKGAEVVAGICGRLRASRRLRAHLQGLTRHHLRLGFLLHRRPLDARAVYEYLDATDPVAVDVTLLTVADRLSARGEGELAKPEMIEAHLELAREMIAAALRWRRDPPRPPVSGEELAAALGIERGPEVGRLLAELRAAAYAGEATDRDSALALAGRLLEG